MEQKIAFLSAPGEDALTGTDAELKAYLAAHRAEFRGAPEVAFEHLFINPDKTEGPAAARADELLTKVKRNKSPLFGSAATNSSWSCRFSTSGSSATTTSLGSVAWSFSSPLRGAVRSDLPSDFLTRAI